MIIVSQLNSPIKQFYNAVNNDKYAEAITVYNSSIKGNSKAETEIKQKLTNDAKDIYSQYKNGKIDYKTAFKKLGNIKKIQLVDLDISSVIFDTNSLNDSQLAYQKGLALNDSKKYLESLVEFKKVIEVDSNYNKAQDYIKTLSEKCKNSIMSEIDSLIDSKNYQAAVETADKALSVFTGNTNIQSKRDVANKLLEQQNAEKDKEKINNLKKSQEVSVESVYTTTGSLLNDVYLIVKVKNNTTKTVKSYKVTWMGFDNNGYPVETGWLNPSKINTGNSEENILPNGFSSSDGGFQLTGGFDKTVKAKTFIACVQSVVYYDGSTWDNPYYLNWLDEYQDKQYH